MVSGEEVLRHLQKINTKTKTNIIKNIDFIYLINLDKRADRLSRCLNQFACYSILPHRVSAIYGWDLTQAAFNDIGLKILPSMSFDRPVHFGPVVRDAIGEWMTPSKVGKTCVHHTMAAGQLGCSLSHLSVLVDAYHSSYETIWVLEDDFTINDPPEELGVYIEKLNALVGPSEWDLLYTDNDDHFSLPTVRDIMGGGNLGRPEMPMTNALIEHRKVGSNFVKIGGRTQTHSMIIRKSGIKKIVEFLLKNGLFRPIDIELSFVPGLKLYNLMHDAVHGRDRTDSDTYYRKS
ncbi:MAG: Glycosyltransferase 25 family er [Parachlamydiales bacterium]|nr:Glycosyltransferase 25 family er [Parachlamydiales bacterium]